LFSAENPVAWTLKGSAPRPGATSTLTLVAKIEPGWHLYGLSQPDEGPRPTRIWLPEEQPYKLAGDIKAPKTRRKFDENFGLEVEYFDGEAAFRIPVRSGPDAAGRVRVSVQYQSCNDRLCLPPKTVTVEN
jgi:thiol:disulfide interchange protein DsbD